MPLSNSVPPEWHHAYCLLCASDTQIILFTVYDSSILFSSGLKIILVKYSESMLEYSSVGRVLA